MHENKFIQREGKQSTRVFDNRSLAKDYRTLLPLLKEGMSVLDVGCGTGAISKDIAKVVGRNGSVTGIDNTEKFIESGKISYQDTKNLELLHVDLFRFEPNQQYDLIVSARVLQWLSNPLEALLKMKEFLKPTGKVSILDYNHNTIEWHPAPPESMQMFYQTFLRWREDAGMKNGIADDLGELLHRAGYHSIETINANEHYEQKNHDFRSKAGIWSDVAASRQMVQEGYLDDDLRLKAIEDYDHWVDTIGLSMTMKLNDVRGVK
ncbi:MAG: class I SAM-dependent methyltransferase [Cyclobacteriaceae bacterium]|nr:class I SAM-dependent methyltransferase [Cyclobacteriaceae bacterium]